VQPGETIMVTGAVSVGITAIVAVLSADLFAHGSVDAGSTIVEFAVVWTLVLWCHIVGSRRFRAWRSRRRS
jgi:hypothetical protein